MAEYVAVVNGLTDSAVAAYQARIAEVTAHRDRLQAEADTYIRELLGQGQTVLQRVQAASGPDQQQQQQAAAVPQPQPQQQQAEQPVPRPNSTADLRSAVQHLLLSHSKRAAVKQQQEEPSGTARPAAAVQQPTEQQQQQLATPQQQQPAAEAAMPFPQGPECNWPSAQVSSVGWDRTGLCLLLHAAPCSSCTALGLLQSVAPSLEVGLLSSPTTQPVLAGSVHVERVAADFKAPKGRHCLLMNRSLSSTTSHCARMRSCYCAVCWQSDCAKQSGSQQDSAFKNTACLAACRAVLTCSCLPGLLPPGRRSRTQQQHYPQQPMQAAVAAAVRTVMCSWPADGTMRGGGLSVPMHVCM